MILLFSSLSMNTYASNDENSQNNMNARSNETYSFGINAINTSVKEGQSMLLTPAYGGSVIVNNNNYGWCRVAVFDWSEEENAYVVISLDKSLGNALNKKAIIPPNGFALVACPTSNAKYSNTVANYTFDNITSLTVGTKVYLEGIDLANSTFEYTGNIDEYYSKNFVTKAFIKVCQEKPANCYEPNQDTLLDTPKFLNMEDLYAIEDIKIEWSSVTGAKEYYVAVYKGSMNTTGDCVITTKTTDNFVSLGAASLREGTRYTVFVYALGEEGYSSPTAHCTFMIGSKRAFDGPFKDMKVVAFGDSITDFLGWVDMLYGELGCEVVNAGVAGDRTSQALRRIEEDVIAENPDLTIINFGMNDQALNGSTNKNLTPIHVYESNYRKIIEKVQATGSDIILVAVHDVDSKQYGGGSPVYNGKDAEGVTYVDRYNAVVKKLAKEYNIGFLDINNLTEDALSFMTVDGIHLNEVGQNRYFKLIADYCYEYAAPDYMDSDNETNNNDEGSSNGISPIVIIVPIICLCAAVVCVVLLMKKKKA